MIEDNLAKEQIHNDYKEILSSEAGRRIIGGIFYNSGLNNPGVKSEYYQGVSDLALLIANTLREIDPHLIADCEIAYKNFLRSFENERDTDNYND